jgi:hypothetical protein
MPEKISSSEANEILRVLVEAISKGYGINNSITDAGIKKEINQFLKSIEEKATTFFRDNIDRRLKLRDKPLIEDMMNLYQVQRNSYL